MRGPPVVVRSFAPLAGLFLAALLAAAPALARDETAVPLDPEEKANWLAAECTKLDAEVGKIEALRDDYEMMDRAAETLKASIKTRSGELMYDRLEFLAGEIEKLRRATGRNDVALRRMYEEHSALNDQYMVRMDQLIRQDAVFIRREVRSHDAMVARLGEAESRWKAEEARYPLAQAERDRVCEESENAHASAKEPRGVYADPEYTEAACAKARSRVKDRETKCDKEKNLNRELLHSLSDLIKSTGADIEKARNLRKTLNCDHTDLLERTKENLAKCQELGKELDRLRHSESSLEAARDDLTIRVYKVCNLTVIAGTESLTLFQM